MLRCLTEKQEEIEDTECKNEVFQFEKAEVADMRNDAPMAVACKADLERYCKTVKPGRPAIVGSALVVANHMVKARRLTIRVSPTHAA